MISWFSKDQDSLLRKLHEYMYCYHTILVINGKEAKLHTHVYLK